MCRTARCPKCNKTTWAGCGAHVEQVMRNVPQDARCRCNEAAGKGQSQSQSVHDGKPSGSGFWARLWGR